MQEPGRWNFGTFHLQGRKKNTVSLWYCVLCEHILHASLLNFVKRQHLEKYLRTTKENIPASSQVFNPS